jgi:hypothetical protein
MNKRRNKSVTKTKHRVQKTKRNRRLNKNRSVKGTRGNNKTKVVGKRRNIVQRGGGEINNLVGRIFALNEITHPQERSAEIKAILGDIVPENFFQVARDRKQSTDDPNPNGPTLLYAACRLKNPSVELVGGILAKMKGGVTMYPIIPNGTSNGSYPQHAAVQATKDILNGNPDNMVLLTQRIDEILQILGRLKDYDDAVAQHTLKVKTVMTPTGSPHTPLMSKTNSLLNGKKYTAYEEYGASFYDESVRPRKQLPSIRDMLITKFQGRENSPVQYFDAVLAPTGPVSLAAGSAGASVLSMGAQANPAQHPPPTSKPPQFVPDIAILYPDVPGHFNDWVKYFDHQTKRYYLYNKTTKETKWEPLASPPAHSVPVAAAAVWEQRLDRDLQKPFWYNNNTKEITWINPQKTGNETTAGITSATVAGHPNPSQSGDPPLPLGWEAIMDPRSRQIYYANPSLKITQWDRPSHTGSVAASSAAPSAGAADALPAGWKINWTLSGEIRYQDLNGNRQKEKPTKPSLPLGWVEKLDSVSGRPYYVNTATVQSVWVRPAIPSSVAAPSPVHVAPSSAGAVLGAAASALPLGWKETRSADGRIYFEDTRTGQTQWERPPTGCTYPVLPLSTHYSRNPTKGSNFIYNGVTYYFSDEMNTRIKHGRVRTDPGGNHAKSDTSTLVYDNIEYTFVLSINGINSVTFMLNSGHQQCLITGKFNLIK